MLFVSYADQNPFQNVPCHSPCFLMNAISDTSVLVVVVFSSSLIGHHPIGWAMPTYGTTTTCLVGNVLVLLTSKWIFFGYRTCTMLHGAMKFQEYLNYDILVSNSRLFG